MPEAPGGLKIIGVVDVLLVIEIDDLLHGEFVAVGLHQHRMRREAESRLLQVHVIGDFSRGGQIFFSRVGDIVSVSPELSKPAVFAGSTGNSRAGRMSTPVRSRIV